MGDEERDLVIVAWGQRRPVRGAALKLRQQPCEKWEGHAKQKGQLVQKEGSEGRGLWYKMWLEGQEWLHHVGLRGHDKESGFI